MPDKPESDHGLILDTYFRACNENQLVELDKIFRPDLALQSFTTDVVGLDAFKGIITGFHQGFPDLLWAAVDKIYTPERIVVRYTFDGTHLGSFRGVPPSNRRVHFDGCEVLVLSDGWVRKIWNYSNLASALSG